jgi:hypothetical protein
MSKRPGRMRDGLPKFWFRHAAKIGVTTDYLRQSSTPFKSRTSSVPLIESSLMKTRSGLNGEQRMSKAWVLELITNTERELVLQAREEKSPKFHEHIDFGSRMDQDHCRKLEAPLSPVPKQVTWVLLRVLQTLGHRNEY